MERTRAVLLVFGLVPAIHVPATGTCGKVLPPSCSCVACACQVALQFYPKQLADMGSDGLVKDPVDKGGFRAEWCAAEFPDVVWSESM